MDKAEASESVPTASVATATVGTSPKSNQIEDAAYITAVITVLTHAIVHELPRRARKDGYHPDKLTKLHQELKNNKEKLFMDDEDWRLLKPTTVVAWATLLGLNDSDNYSKYLNVKYNDTHKIGKVHLDRMQVVLTQLKIIPKLDVGIPPLDDTPSSWRQFLCYTYEAITGENATAVVALVSGPRLRRITHPANPPEGAAPTTGRNEFSRRLRHGDRFTEHVTFQ